MKKSVGLFFWVILSFIACRKIAQPPTVVRQFTDQQLAAEFPSDLGPDQVDVSLYPPEQQANYNLFAQKCAQCHTLARSINSSFTTEEDWTRYVTRMHSKTEDRFQEKLLDGTEAKKVIGFLVFDSKQRKSRDPQDFQRHVEQLTEMFKSVQEERTRVQNQQGREKAREAAPYTGDKPS